MQNPEYIFDETNIIREKVSHRGGGIEISLEDFGWKGERMAAYQNYLGGGMLARVDVNWTVSDADCTDELLAISEALKMHYHALTNPDEDEWEHTSYDGNQSMSTSAY